MQPTFTNECLVIESWQYKHLLLLWGKKHYQNFGEVNFEFIFVLSDMLTVT